jgi:type I restriction-modification system DNA methylase subunit
MTAPKSIIDLVSRFTSNRESYSASSYNETQLRREFLDPFFEALGWDVPNIQGYAEAYKEVIHEDAVKVGTATKAPDYSFRIGGTRKFFVEAKKPFVNIKDNIDPAFQLRRYAWSAKLPLSILTDFEEFAVYDCRKKPSKNDKASVERILYIKFDEYEKRWDEISSIFSKDAILKGSFDKYAESARGKKGTSEVDDEFLQEISRWRDLLARNIAINNPKLSQRELNFAVQRTIDRLIFLRICEDRGIEQYGTLMALLNGENIYKRIRQNFQRADEIYNSGLFHFKDERGRAEPPDTFTLSLSIDDKPFKDIIGNLYYPESPYEFSILPADILGQVYEQFLGKVIRLTAGHQAKVEDKPEVKKAGGVFYTPTYIVDYIVKNTVGKLVDGKTPKQIEKLKILDPACGSGSFLILAYQFLLDYCRDWYIEDGIEKHSKGKAPELVQVRSGEWRLSTPERKKILLNSIHGVDIDSQAVEVTKLSLLLKVLEGENEQSLAQQMTLWHERALPSLANNIKCGNSLIGTDFYEGTQERFCLYKDEDEERIKINVFDWDGENGFTEIMKNGGFDAVIGNPPYIRIQTLQEASPKQVSFLSNHYKSAASGNYDIYVVFVEKGLQLLNKSGKLGFILPHKFFNAKYGEALRELISKNKCLSKVIHFSDQQVFKGATTYTCLLFLLNSPNKVFDFIKVNDLEKWHKNENVDTTKINIESIGNKEWNFSAKADSNLIVNLKANKLSLGMISFRIAQGIRTSANEVYVLDVLNESSKHYIAKSSIFKKEVKIEKDITNLFLQGRDIKKYRIIPSNKIVIIPYRKASIKASEFIPEDEMSSEYPLAYKYLLENKKYLENREHGRMKGDNWYGYVYPKNIEVMSSKKILIPDIADRASFALDEGGTYTFTSGYGIVLKEGIDFSENYILGLLNSKLLYYYLTNISTPMRGGFFRYFTQYIEQLPIKQIKTSSEKSLHDKIVSFVASMLEFHKKLPVARTDHEKTLLQRQIDATDKKIDELVYELYGLTEEEIKIVEGNTDK